jgi:putative flippase GtrA
VLRFGVIGGISTVAYALLYLALQAVLPGQLANFLALLITAVANTWANRRFTFGVRGSRRFVRHHLQGLVVFGMAWGITSGSLALLHALQPSAGPHLELLVLTVANLVATVLRFVALRVWVFRSRAEHAPREQRQTLTSRDQVVLGQAQPDSIVRS